MSNSKLIELSYYDPSAQVRLSAYADTIVLDHNEKGGVICAIRFGGYPEMVRAMADAIYGGATIEATQNDTVRLLQSSLKGYRRQLTHDGVYAVATLMASDDTQEEDRQQDDGEERTLERSEQPRKCYIYCPEGDRTRLFEEMCIRDRDCAWDNEEVTAQACKLVRDGGCHIPRQHSDCRLFV